LWDSRFFTQAHFIFSSSQIGRETREKMGLCILTQAKWTVTRPTSFYFHLFLLFSSFFLSQTKQSLETLLNGNTAPCFPCFGSLYLRESNPSVVSVISIIHRSDGSTSLNHWLLVWRFLNQRFGKRGIY
jgi:hypothetical protein